MPDTRLPTAVHSISAQDPDGRDASITITPDRFSPDGATSFDRAVIFSIELERRKPVTITIHEDSLYGDGHILATIFRWLAREDGDDD